jgi:O-antigen ligase
MGLTARQVYEAEGEMTWNDHRYTIAGLNENDLGLILALSLPVALYLLARRTGWPTTLLACVSLVACVPALLLTGSRGGLLAAAPALVMLLLVISRLPRGQKLVAVIMCMGVIATTLYFVPDRTWDRLFTTMREFSGGTLTHRTVIWAASMEAFRNHALLGVGAGAHSAAVLQAVDVPYVAHNSFLSVLVELGVIGELIFGALLASMIYCVFRLRSLDRWMWICFLLVWAIGVSALTWEYRKPTWFMFGVLAAHAYARNSRFARFREAL